MKTIKEVSEELGISKTSVYNMIKKDALKKHISKKDNITYIDDVGFKILTTYYEHEKSKTINDSIQAIIEEAGFSEDSDIVELLREQVKQKDNEINSLIQLLSNQQTLTARQMITSKEIKEKEIIEQPKEIKKESIIKRLFKNKQINKKSS